MACKRIGCPMTGSSMFAGYCCYMCYEALPDTYVRHGPWCVGRGQVAKPPGPHPTELAEKNDALKLEVTNLSGQVNKLSGQVKQLILLVKALLAMGLGTFALKVMNKWRAK